MDKIRPIQLDFNKDIDEILSLKHKYENTVKETHANSTEAIDAYHSWYNKTLVVCNRIFGSDDADVKKFRSVDNGGNGYCLKDNYHELLSTYSVLMDRLRHLPVEEPTPKCAKDPESIADSKPLVFISHAGNDKYVIKLFIDYILKNGLGLRDDNIACTSFEENTMKGGEDIPLYIKRTIKDSSVVLSMVSQNYRRSEVCMNEVGAAWALDNSPIQIVLPDADFDSIGWLVSLKKALKISERDNLDNLCETLCQRLGIAKPSIKSWNGAVTTFLEQLPKVCALEKKDYVYLTFENDSTEIVVEVPIVANYYVFEQSNNTQNEIANKFIWGKHTPNIIETCLPKIKPIDSFGRSKKNQSMLPFQFWVHSEKEHIENVEVIIESEEVQFSDSNIVNGLRVTPLNKNISIEPHRSTYHMGDINPGMKHKTADVFIEFTSLYNNHNASDFSDNKTYVFNLKYSISTKSGLYDGILTLNVKPSYIRRQIDNNAKIGRISTLAYVE